MIRVYIHVPAPNYKGSMKTKDLLEHESERDKVLDIFLNIGNRGRFKDPELHAKHGDFRVIGLVKISDHNIHRLASHHGHGTYPAPPEYGYRIMGDSPSDELSVLAPPSQVQFYE